MSTSIDTIQPEASSAPPRSPEASVYPDLAAIVTAAVMGMMFYFGPWADPPGMDELWWLLTTAAVILASWRWWGKPTSYLITRVSIIIAAFPGV